MYFTVAFWGIGTILSFSIPEFPGTETKGPYDLEVLTLDIISLFLYIHTPQRLNLFPHNQQPPKQEKTVAQT